MKGDFRVLPRGDDGWKVQRDGSERATALHGNKAEATADARKRSRNAGTELFIHNRNGQMSARDSHGNDPKRFKG